MNKDELVIIPSLYSALHPEFEMESATTWQIIKLICEAFLEVERESAVQEAERIVKGENDAQ